VAEIDRTACFYQAESEISTHLDMSAAFLTLYSCSEMAKIYWIAYIQNAIHLKKKQNFKEIKEFGNHAPISLALSGR
jgi:hypothetical protein